MAGTALDLSGVNVGQAVDKMSNQVLGAAKFDYEKREKNRIEFMSDMELTDLNQNLSIKNADDAIAKVDEFKNKWYGIYEERNGRLNDKDRLEMRKDKQNIERDITRTNAIQAEFERSQQEIRFGRNSSQYDRDEFQRLSDKYQDGEPPPDGRFLKLRPVNFEYYLTNVKYPQQYNLDEVRKYNPSTKSFETQTVRRYADNETKDNAIQEFMLADSQFALGVTQSFTSLPHETQEDYIQRANSEGKNPYILFAQETGRDILWPDIYRETDIQSPSSINFQSGGRTTKEPITPVFVPNQKIQSKTYDGGYDLSGLKFTADRLLIADAVNLRTGESESFDGGVRVTDLLFYDEDNNKIVAVFERKNYRTQRMSGGEPLFRVEDPGGSPVQVMLTKSEADNLARQRGDGFKVAPDMEKKTQDFVEYEVDTKKHPAILEAIKRSGVIFPKRDSAKKSVITLDELRLLPFSDRANYVKNQDGTYTKK